jgi:hypothetical protein
MSKLIKNKWILSLAFSIYEALVLVVFGIHHFWGFTNNILMYIILFTGLFIVEFSILHFIKNIKNSSKKALFKSFSFLCTGIIIGLLSWIFFRVESNVFFSYILAFLVSSFFPTLTLYIFTLLNHTLSNVENLYQLTIQNQQIENEEQNAHVFQLENQSGKVILKLKMKNILCFEANDNYVNIYFLKNETEIKKNMERISLRKVESLIPSDADSFTRIHKSYIINTQFIEKINGKSQAYRIQLKGLSFEVPVSRSFDINTIEIEY